MLRSIALKVDLVCPSCKADNLRYSKFCGQCGLRFEAGLLHPSEACKLPLELEEDEQSGVAWLASGGPDEERTASHKAPRPSAKGTSSGPARAGFDLQRVALTAGTSFAAVAFIAFIWSNGQQTRRADAVPSERSPSPQQSSTGTDRQASASVAAPGLVVKSSSDHPSGATFPVSNIPPPKPTHKAEATDPPATLPPFDPAGAVYMKPSAPLAASGAAPLGPAQPAVAQAAPPAAAVRGDDGGRSLGGSPLDNTGWSRPKPIPVTNSVGSSNYRQIGAQLMARGDYRAAAQEYRSAIFNYHAMLASGQHMDEARAGLADAEDGLARALRAADHGAITVHSESPAG